MRNLLACLLVFLVQFTRTSAYSQELTPPGQQIEALRLIAVGQGPQSLAYYETRAVEFEKLAGSDGSSKKYLEEATRNYRLASMIAGTLGNFDKSVSYAERMLVLAEKLQDTWLLLRALNRLVNAYRETFNFAKAAEFNEYGFEIVNQMAPTSIDRVLWNGRLNKNKGDFLAHKKDFRKAVEAYRRSIDSVDEFLVRYRAGGEWKQWRVAALEDFEVKGYISIGRVYYLLGELDLALASYRRGLEIAAEWNADTTQSTLYRGIGEVLYSRGEFSEALANFHKALELGRREQRPEMILDAARWIAQTLQRSGKAAEAIGFYEEAIRQAETVRSLLGSETTRQSYFAARVGAYEGIVGTLSITGAHERAFDYNERARSRSFLDVLGTKVQLARQASEIAEQKVALAQQIVAAGRIAEEGAGRIITSSEKVYSALTEATRKQDREQASLLSVEPLTLRQVQKLLESGQLLLEYFVTPQQVYFWAVDKQKLHSFSVRVSHAELVKSLGALRTAIAERKSTKEYQALARELYNELIAPAESFIQGKELIIVPHDVLHNLPFHALIGADGHYLIENYPIEYLSSASLMQFTQAKRRAIGKKVLAFGNPAVNERVKELKFAEQETAQLKKFFPDTTRILRSEATKVKAKELAPQYDILHFAAHTELKQDDPLSSAVLLAASGSDDGRLEVRDVFGLDLKASLVVLSGCETALGKLSTGDELVGLTRAFIYAGTPSVVASLWKVDDASTAYLMSSFYKNLKTKSKVESLRQAQLDMIRGNVSAQLLAQRGVGGIGKLSDARKSAISAARAVSTSHPYFWAPFILVGDGK